ncbi:MAG: polysaccharide deacetylase family protein [Candidatus Omnitrophica bacterium]|nr:polysaccharide deacetylase family protein [Candidatus Omnitrophota bacterium]
MRGFLKTFLIVIIVAVLAAGSTACFFIFQPKKLESLAFVPPKAQNLRDLVRQAVKRSEQLTIEGVKALEMRDIKGAIQKFDEAVEIFPPSTEAYSYLVKIYLMGGQEDRMFDILEHSGHSYPSFDGIIRMIDNASLLKLPAVEDAQNVYIARFKDNRKMAISFMFDDGEESVYRGILPIFEKYGFRATIPVIGAEVTASPGDPYRGSWSEWKDAANRGFEIASHSMHHRDAKTLTNADFKVEIDDVKAMIEKNVGKPVYTYVFPLDSYTDTIVNYALGAYEAIRVPFYLRKLYPQTTSLVYGGLSFSLETANRIADIGIQRRWWVIAECHGLQQENEKSYKPVTQDFLEGHLTYLKQRPADVWVDTFHNIFQYVSARKTTTVERRDVAPGRADIVLHADVPNKALPVGLTVVLKTNGDAGAVSARADDGEVLRAWPCGTENICVEMNACDRTAHVQWK